MSKQEVFYDGYGYAHFACPRKEIGEVKIGGPVQIDSAGQIFEPKLEENCLAYNRHGDHKIIRQCDMGDFNKLGWFSSQAEAKKDFEATEAEKAELISQKEALKNVSDALKSKNATKQKNGKEQKLDSELPALEDGAEA